MRLGLRLLFAFFVITGLAGFFALQVFQSEVKPSAREVLEYRAEFRVLGRYAFEGVARRAERMEVCNRKRFSLDEL